MSDERYRCVCHTCETEQLMEGLERAQAFFNEHAERSHEVELFNRRRRRRYSNASTDDEAADDRSTGSGSDGDATDSDPDDGTSDD